MATVWCSGAATPAELITWTTSGLRCSPPLACVREALRPAPEAGVGIRSEPVERRPSRRRSFCGPRVRLERTTGVRHQHPCCVSRGSRAARSFHDVCLSTTNRRDVTRAPEWPTALVLQSWSGVAKT
eukprot:XP_001700569.1 predicted protein [Chlamydomonas reinhardtii]